MTAVIARPALFCVIAGEHRHLAVAEDACAGRFTHCGVTLELGVPPDWSTAGLEHDPEWRIECSKFLWGLDLAHAHAATGEPRFRRAWEDLVSSWIDQVPAGADAPEVAARRLQNWVYAREAFGPSSSLDAVLVGRIADEAAYVWANLAPARNHRTLELYGLFVAALGVPELDPDGSLAELALAELAANLEADFHADGVHREASTHYHALAVRSLLAALENARRFGLDPGLRYEEQLVRACEFLRHVRRPGGGIPALSDADGGDYGELLALGAALLDRPDLCDGTSPAMRHASFPDGGYFVQRSGWDADALYLVFDCGPLGDGGHGHYDALAVEAAGFGCTLLVDPGRFTYAEGAPNLRRWFKSTAAHNTVTVDGLDQTPYACGKPRGPVAVARAGLRTTTPGLDVLRGEVRSPAYDAVHARTILFVRDAYWVVEDVLEGDVDHRYDLRFHLASDDASVDGGSITAPGLTLAIEGADEVALEPGWVAPSYGVREAAVVVSALRSGRSARFTTLIAPVRPNEPPPRLVACTRGRAEVKTGRDRDVLTWSDTEARLG
jgi:Heparinase II/III-like protein/Heparinase II/III N-terminus